MKTTAYREELTKLYNPTRRRVPLKCVLAHGSQFLGASLSLLASPVRTDEIYNKRTILAVAAWVLTDRSNACIASHLKRDHTTTLHAVKSAAADLRSESKIAKSVKHIIWYILDREGMPVTTVTPLVSGTRKRITFPKCDLPQFTEERRACHRSTVAYASALYRAHGETARWPEVNRDTG